MDTQNPTATKYVLYLMQLILLSALLAGNQILFKENRFTFWMKFIRYEKLSTFHKKYDFPRNMISKRKLSLSLHYHLIFYRQVRPQRQNSSTMSPWLLWFVLENKDQTLGYFITNISTQLMESGRLIWITKQLADKIKLKS